MYIYDPAIQLLVTPKRKLFLCSQKVMYKSICVSTIHNTPKMEVLKMSIRMQMCRNFWSMKYHIAKKMNKVLPRGTTWINLITMLGERSQT